MAATAPRKGDPLYVPASEIPMALSIGAAMVEGDARLFVPTVLPDGVTLETFSRWTTDQARLVWVGELLESVIGEQVDIFSIAGLLANADDDASDDVVPLFVPSSEMDLARKIPGVWWDRSRRMYVADSTANFGLVHRYLTPAMRAAWVADRNVETALSALVRARAMIQDKEDVEPPSLELGREPGKQAGEDEG